jgi:transcriptional regulator with AAA-type ATPase domain/tetratricopeptide (TPR) repeat protein
VPGLREIFGESRGIAAIREQVTRLLERPGLGARRLPPILILGETGTGKGLLAGAIHRTGPRAAGPFIDVNCAAIPETLLEAELFGFERGAFTDARQAKAGLFQAAHGGTLFLDEVGLLPESLQAKLLKTLEERTVRRLGSTRSETVDLWLVAATSEDLRTAVRARRFREDLYHRLAVVTLQLPPLRERGEDIPRLAEHFLRRACEDYGLPLKTLTAEARTMMLGYQWPGNVRELANAMERVALLAEGTAVAPTMLGLWPSRGFEGTGSTAVEQRRAVKETETEAERDRLLTALRAAKWNISRAAAQLGVPRNTLRYRMDKHGLGSGSLAPRLPGNRAGVTAPREPSEETPAPPLVPPEHAAPAGIRWESRRLTFLRVQLASPGAELGSSELSRAMEVIVDKVQSFGGTVDELRTAGLVATFGLAPVEDALQHAAFAAIAIRKIGSRARPEHSPPPTVTLALHTELARVGRHREGVAVDGDAKRAAWAVLEAMAELAEPNTVAVSPQTVTLLAPRFELVPVGSAAGPGAGTHRLMGARDFEQGLSRFVGREAELGLLRGLFDQARAGHGQLVSIVGEPGIGKSRLLRELRRGVHEGATWMEGHALSFGQTIPFHPLIDLLRRTFGIDEGDPPAVVVEKIERTVLQLGEDLRPGLPFVRHLLMVDSGDPGILRLDPKLRRAEIFDAMRRQFVRVAESRPIIVVWEDLHWADGATEEFIAGLADSLAAHRSLMIVTHRPGYAPPLGDRMSHTRLALTALSAADSATMACGLLSADELPEALQALLVHRTEGNPFFMEEVLRSLQETKALRWEGNRLVVARDLETLAVPATIEDVLRTRIQRVSDASRQILEVASVIGREFSRRLVDRILDSPEGSEGPLRELTAAELIQQKSPFPELTYMFTHALTHDVAYGALPPERRAELHRRVGLAIEGLYGDRLPGRDEVLARHFSKAEEWPKALTYLVRAAEKAASTFAVREALTLYDHALEAVSRPGRPADLGTLIEIHQARAALYFVVSEFDRSRAEAEHVMLLARQAGDRAWEARALAAIAWAAMWARDLEGAVAHAREAIEVAKPGAGDTVARSHFTIGFVRAVSGGLDEARGAIDRALVTSQSSGQWAARSLSLSVAGLLKNWEGAYDAASRLQGEGLALAREHHLLVPLLFNFFLHGITLTGKGDYEGALALYREGLSFAEKVGDETIHHRLLNCLGWLHAELGDLEGAIDLNRRSADIGRRRDDPGTFPNAEINLGEIYLAKGDLIQAQDCLEKAYRFWDNPRTSEWMRWRYSMRLFASLGELWLARGDPERATEFADRCLDLATRTNSRRNVVKGWRLRGQIAFARRQLDDAETAFRQALAIAEAIGNPTQLWTTQAALGRLHAARQRHDLAGDAYRAARDVIGRVKAGLRDSTLRTSLDQALAVRGLHELVGPA